MTAKDPNVKSAEEQKPEGQFNLDGILSELGSFGKYHLFLLLLLAFRDSFLAMCNLHYVFTAADVKYRCHVPECELQNETQFSTSWFQYALQNNTDTCHRMAPIVGAVHNASLASKYWNVTNPKWTDSCSPWNFNEVKMVPCENIVYEDYNSIAAEFDLGCEPWKRTLIGTVHNLGLVFSYIVSGFISDRYGRKVIIVGTPLMVGVLGILKSFSINYWMLLVLEFLEAALGYGNASLVLSLEAVNQNNRVIYSCISDSLSNLGAAFFGVIAWKVPYWRHMMRAIYTPLLIVVFYIFLVDEGVRWLLAHNKKNEAVRILHKVAKFNKVTLSTKAIDMLEKITEDRKTVTEFPKLTKREKISNIFSDLRSKTILLRLALIAACFFCVTFVYNGAIINATGISGNKYLNYSALMLVSIPMRVVTALTLTRFGRKAPICVAYCLCAVFFVTSAFVPKSISWASVLFYLGGKMGSSYGSFAMFVVALEVFPTTSRNTMVNIANTIGRFGSVIAPQTPLLRKYMDGLPSIVFGVVALGPCLLSLLLPDTSKVPLPEDLKAAEKLDRAGETTPEEPRKSDENV